MKNIDGDIQMLTNVLSEQGATGSLVLHSGQVAALRRVLSELKSTRNASVADRVKMAASR